MVEQTKNFEYFIAVPAWGDTYVDTFLNISLPTLLADMNLPYLRDVAQVRFSIHTSRDDADKIRNHSLILKAIQDRLNIEILEIKLPVKSDFQDDHDFYKAMYETKSKVYRENIDLAKRSRANHKVIVSLNADIVYSNNFFMESHKILTAGKKVIEVVGPRGQAKPIKSILSNLKRNDGSISVDASDLLDIWIDNHHPLLDIHFWNGDSEHFNCSHLMWPLTSGKGWLAKCFFLYPIILMLPDSKIEFSGTIDQDLVVNCGYSIDDAAVISKSNVLFCCELSEDDKFVGAFAHRHDYADIANVYKNFGSNYNFSLLQENIILGHSYNEDDLSATISEATKVITRINHALSTTPNRKSIISSFKASIKRLVSLRRRLLRVN